MSGVRHRVTIIGPGAPGFLRARFHLKPDDVEIDVHVEKLPRALQQPNATFVALIKGRELVRVETDGELWLEIQGKVREVLNREWDPIGVSEVVDDEYDIYIDELYRLVKRQTSTDEIAMHLRSIEIDRIGLRASSDAQLRGVAISLRRLALPEFDEPEPSGRP